jgi:hypothetical protein
LGLDVTYTTSGRQSLWGYDQGSTTQQPSVPADYSIAMTKNVAVPANAHLHFRHSFDFEASFSEAFDGGVVEYSTNNGSSWNDAKALFSDNGYNTSIANDSTNPLHGRDVFGYVSQGYYSSRLDLSPLAGQNVRFRFRIGTDSFGDAYGWFIDDLRVYTCSATAPVVSLPAGTATVAESGGSIAVQLTLSGVTDKPVSVPFTVSGTADPASDYRLNTRSFIIPAGSSSGRVAIEITNDTLQEPAETVVLTLGTPTNATLGAGTQVSVTIQDNDTILFQYVPMIRR